jgi:hypothetical protein
MSCSSNFPECNVLHSAPHPMDAAPTLVLAFGPYMN